MSLGRLLAAGRSLIGVKEKSGRYQMRPAALLPKFVSDKNPFGTPPPPEVAKPEKAAAQELEPSVPGRRRPQGSAAPGKPTSEVTKTPAPKPQTAKQITPSLFEPIAPEKHADHSCAPALMHGVPPLGGEAAASTTVRGTSNAPDLADLQPANPSSLRSSDAPRAGTPYSAESAEKSHKAVEPNITRPLPAPARPRIPLGARIKKLNPLAFLSALKPAAKPARPHRDRLPEQTELSLERVIPVRNDLSDADLEVISLRPAKPAEVPTPTPLDAQAMTPVLAGRVPEPTTWERLSSRWFGAGQTTQTQTH